MRWLEKLEEYTWEHKPGKKPANANSCKFSELQVSEPMPVDAVHQQDQPNNMTPFQSRSKEEVDRTYMQLEETLEDIHVGVM